MKPRNRSAWLWLGVSSCTASGLFFGAIIGGTGGNPLAGILLGLATGFSVGIYGARKSVGR